MLTFRVSTASALFIAGDRPNLFEKGAETFFVVKYEGIIIAYIAAYIDKYNVGCIASLAVLSNYRGKGLATLLINKILQIFKENEVYETVLHVKEPNK